MNQRTTVTGVILAGGESRRFGSPKALAKLGNQTFIERAVQLLQEEVDDLLIIAHSTIASTIEKLLPSVTVITDVPDHAGKGPLAGIYTAMDYANSHWYFVMPCDMPYLSKESIRTFFSHQRTEDDAVLSCIHNRTQPLVGLYHERVKTTLEDCLSRQDLRVMKALDLLNVHWLTEKHFDTNVQREFQNINTPNSVG
ncbi:molybdenum cofactor guanylyltransferase [Priestia koreensis]|nr:molybdenum cofactor guanylyltransferase [Priestia koreensis]